MFELQLTLYRFPSFVYVSILIFEFTDKCQLKLNANENFGNVDPLIVLRVQEYLIRQEFLCAERRCHRLACLKKSEVTFMLLRGGAGILNIHPRPSAARFGMCAVPVIRNMSDMDGDGEPFSQADLDALFLEV